MRNTAWQRAWMVTFRSPSTGNSFIRRLTAWLGCTTAWRRHLQGQRLNRNVVFQETASPDNSKQENNMTRTTLTVIGTRKGKTIPIASLWAPWAVLAFALVGFVPAAEAQNIGGHIGFVLPLATHAGGQTTTLA